MNDVRKAYYPAEDLSEAQLGTIAALRDSFAELADSLENTLQPGRNKARALTALEDASMYAIKAVTHG